MVPFITPANASALSQLGHAAKAAKRQQMANLGIVDSYLAKKLARVRKQLDMLDDQLEQHSDDPKAVQAIATAQLKLWEIEGWLSGRSKPGLTKPTAPRKATNTPVEPLN